MPMPATALTVTVTWQAGQGSPDVDVSGLLVGESGKFSSAADMVFYNAPAHSSGAVTHPARHPGAMQCRSTWPPCRPPSTGVVVAASSDGGTFGSVPALALTLTDASGAQLARFDITDAATETAFAFGELYRRADAWKFRAVGQAGRPGWPPTSGSASTTPRPLPRLRWQPTPLLESRPARPGPTRRLRVLAAARGVGPRRGRAAPGTELRGKAVVAGVGGLHHRPRAHPRRRRASRQCESGCRRTRSPRPGSLSRRAGHQDACRDRPAPRPLVVPADSWPGRRQSPTDPCARREPRHAIRPRTSAPPPGPGPGRQGVLLRANRAWLRQHKIAATIPMPADQVGHRQR